MHYYGSASIRGETWVNIPIFIQVLIINPKWNVKAITAKNIIQQQDFRRGKFDSCAKNAYGKWRISSVKQKFNFRRH